MPIKLVDKLKGIWYSTKVIEVPNYDSNFSNWIGQIPVAGIFKFEVEEFADKTYQCQVKIPISGNGYFAIYSGRFDNQKNKILIWQNANTPVKIPYKWQEKILELKLFNKKILFEQVS